MEHAAPAWAHALEASALGALMRESAWLYPAANVLHVLAVGVLIGTALAFDLRLLGMGRRLIGAEGAVRYLSPLAAGALLLAIPMGFLVFVADAGPLSTNPILWAKFVLIALGVINAVLFRVFWTARLATWDEQPPPLGRLQARISALGWLAAAYGRLIAYL
jgi:hypothetical protein